MTTPDFNLRVFWRKFTPSPCPLPSQGRRNVEGGVKICSRGSKFFTPPLLPALDTPAEAHPKGWDGAVKAGVGDQINAEKKYRED